MHDDVAGDDARRVGQTFLDLLASIEWFAQCCEPLIMPVGTPVEVFKLTTWDEARRAYARVAWETTTMDAHNLVSNYLAGAAPDEFHRWGDTLRAMTKIREELVDDHVEEARRAFNLDQRFVDAVRWDVLGALMEEAYAEFNPPRFSTLLLGFYALGHFPCGWIDGEFPEGKLVVL